VRETPEHFARRHARGVRLELVATAIRSVEGVNDVHDLHCWSIGSETRALLLSHSRLRTFAVGQRTHPARCERKVTSTTSASTTLRFSSSMWNGEVSAWMRDSRERERRGITTTATKRTSLVLLILRVDCFAFEDLPHPLNRIRLVRCLHPDAVARSAGSAAHIRCHDDRNCIMLLKATSSTIFGSTVRRKP